MAILESRTKTGISWVKESVVLFKMQPSKWMLLAMAYVSIFMMLPSLFQSSTIAMGTVLIWPIFTAFAIMLFRNADIGKKESLQQTIALIKPRLTVLISLGLICLLYATLISYLLNSDIEALVPFAESSKAMDEAQYMLFMEKFMPFLLKLLLLLLPLFISTWFSPMLIVINRYPVLKAIKSSIAGTIQYTVAMGVSWIVLTAAVFLLMLALGLVVGILAQLMPFIAQTLMPILIFGTLLVTTALMFAFQYVSYRDVFRAAVADI
jgi:hypothetical protein